MPSNSAATISSTSAPPSPPLICTSIPTSAPSPSSKPCTFPAFISCHWGNQETPEKVAAYLAESRDYALRAEQAILETIQSAGPAGITLRDICIKAKPALGNWPPERDLDTRYLAGGHIERLIQQNLIEPIGPPPIPVRYRVTPKIKYPFIPHQNRSFVIFQPFVFVLFVLKTDVRIRVDSRHANLHFLNFLDLRRHECIHRRLKLLQQLLHILPPIRCQIFRQYA